MPLVIGDGRVVTWVSSLVDESSTLIVFFFQLLWTDVIWPFLVGWVGGRGFGFVDGGGGCGRRDT